MIGPSRTIDLSKFSSNFIGVTACSLYFFKKVSQGLNVSRGHNVSAPDFVFMKQYLNILESQYLVFT